MRIEHNCLWNGIDIYNIIEDNKIVGSMELIHEKDHIFLENIYLDKEYRGRGFLRESLKNFNTKPIVCLPLIQHRKKFKHLGFREYKTEGPDIYYIR